MSLIASTCAPAADDLLGQPQVVVEGVERSAGSEQVAGVAQRHLGDRGAGGADRVDGRAHLVDVVERVEDPEDVDAGARRLGHERVGHLGRVRRVADGVAPAQQHLQADVGHGLAQRGQPLPRVLGEEAQRHVVRRPAPRLHAQQLRGQPGRRGRPTASRSRVRTRVASSDWWASRKVVSVTATAACCAQRGGELLRPHPQQQVARAGRRRRVEVDGGAACSPGRACRALRAVRLVDRHVGQVGQQLGAAVGGAARRRAAAGRSSMKDVDSRPATKSGLVQQRLQERDVGGHAADAELGQRPAGAAHGGRRSPRRGR